MIWRKQERRAFIPVTWIGSKDGRDLFTIYYHVSTMGRFRRSYQFRLRSITGESMGTFPKLAEAKACAEGRAA